VSVTIELPVEFPESEAAHLCSGWRGLVDFGEEWTDSDGQLWQQAWGPMPLGEPLRYGCELQLVEPVGGPVTGWRGHLRLWALNERLTSMASGTTVTLFDGGAVRALGRLADS
jgi:hypothetical protein